MLSRTNKKTISIVMMLKAAILRNTVQSDPHLLTVLTPYLRN